MYYVAYNFSQIHASVRAATEAKIAPAVFPIGDVRTAELVKLQTNVFAVQAKSSKMMNLASATEKT